MRAIVLRGALAGALGGLGAWVFALLFANPLAELAIAYEEQYSAAEEALTAATAAGHGAHGGHGGHGAHGGEEELVSRGVQSTIGLGAGAVATGVVLGLVFALAYALVQGRVPLRPRPLAALVAAGGFLALSLVPFLKYPANPPAVGNGDTTATRQALYLLAVLGAVVVLVVAVLLWHRLAPRLGGWNAGLTAIATFVVLAGVLMALLPALGDLAPNADNGALLATETPQPLRDGTGTIVLPGFDADLLYWYRLYSVATQALLWAVVGVAGGALIERYVDRSPSPSRPTVGARS